MLPQPCLLGPPKEGGNATSPLHSRGSPTPSAGNGIRSGYLSPAFLRARKRGEILPHPCILEGPQQRGKKSEVATSSWPSRGPNRGRKCYVTPAFTGCPNKGEQNQKWLPHLCVLVAQKEIGRHPCLLGSRGSGSAGCKNRSGPQQRGTKLEVAASSLPSRGPKRGRKGYVTPAFSGAPNED